MQNPVDNDIGLSVRRIQLVTVVWMSIETTLSLWSAWRAHSPALAAFGGDSAVELISAVVVLWRFKNYPASNAERFATQLTGGLLFALAICVVLISALSLLGYTEPRPSYLGMAVLTAAALIMPWLAKEKRRLSAITGSAALRADAAESAICFYLSVTALLGLALHTFLHIRSADPVAALAIVPFILFEGREALRGKPCNCS